MLTDRKIRILGDMIRTYIRQAHPVGSEALLESGSLTVSPATVRNDMLELEQDGYLFQPHTSAGRIPTEKGWRYYLDHFLKERPLDKREQGELRAVVRAYRHSQEELLKHLAQTLADLTEQAVFVAFGPRDTYYTGISKLFDQPEFEEVDLIRNISRVVDHLDEVMPKFFSRLHDDVAVLLGHDNLVSDACGLILSPLPKRRSLLGLIGPLRQDYDTNVSFVRFTHGLLQDA